MSEYAMTVLSEPLNRLLGEQAPACSVAFDSVPPSWDRFESQLMRRDLIVVPLGFDFPGIKQPIYSDELACLVSRGNPYLTEGSLTLDDLLAMPHAVAHFLLRRRSPAAAGTGDAASGSAGPAGARPGHQPADPCPSRCPAPACAPLCRRRLALRCLDLLDLVIADTPLEPITIIEAGHWHPRRADDPAGIWLRRLLYDVAVDIEGDE